MTKIAIIVDGDLVYPILRIDGMYCVEFGRSVGRSDLFSFKNDVEAINWFRKAFSRGVATVREAWE